MALPLIGAIAGIASSLIGASAASKAAKAQAAATKYAADIQRQNYTDSLAALQPSINAGNTARDYQLGSLVLPGGIDRASAEAAFRESPGYDFALKTGQNQVQTSAAAGGRLFSGGTLKALDRYGQGMADQQFGTWYDRLSGLSGAGNGSTGTAVNLGTTTAGNLGNLAVQGGNDRASSFINGAGAINTGIGTLADLYARYGGGGNNASAATPFNKQFNPNTASQGFIY
jgi:hypothetical protein